MVSVPPWLIPNPIASTTGELTDANQVVVDNTNLTGVVTGAVRTQAALERLDATGIGAAITTFTQSFEATGANIDTWFNGRQQNRLRWTDDGAFLPPTFTLPGDTALGAAFDLLNTAGLPEVLRFIIEYTGPASTSLRVIPRSGATTVIQNTSIIVIRSGAQAVVEVTRTGGVISNYIFQSVGGIGDTTGGTLDAVKLINPSEGTFDASANGTLPSIAVVEGNAYRVVNAPADGSGRFGQRMRNGDRVVWAAPTFTSWAAQPAQWFVLPLLDVIRGSALDEEFLTYTELSAQSDRNTVLRGANYADSAGEIRLKLYATRAGYDAADLNTTGDIDEFTDPSTQTSFLAIRLPGTQANLADVLPTLYVYEDTPAGTTVRLLNLVDDFSFEGNFGQESDYLSLNPINYVANDTIRIYIGTVVDRFFNPNLDINESNLSLDVQQKLNRVDPSGNVDEQRLANVESKVDALFPLTPDVGDLTAFADIFAPDQAVTSVAITPGYSLIADYRGDATRYESAGVTYDNSGMNVVRYTGLTADLHRVFGFRVSGPADQVLLWLVDGSEVIPFVDINMAGNLRINNYTPAGTEDQQVENQSTFLTRTSGDQVLTRASNSLSTFTITNFPANATQTSRSLQVGTDVYINGVNTEAEHLLNIPLPAENTAQPTRTVQSTTFTGPLHGNRNVTITLSYELRVSGGSLLVDFRLVEAPSNITIELDNVVAQLSYTHPVDVARVDNFETFGDGLGNFAFTGVYDFLLSFQPQNVASNTQNAVMVAISGGGTVTEMNDILVPEPNNQFASVEVPDAAAVTGYQFRTFLPNHFFRHSELSQLLQRRSTQWAYGLALLNSVSELAISSQIDFQDGIVLTSPDASRWQVAIDNSGVLQTTKL